MLKETVLSQAATLQAPGQIETPRSEGGFKAHGTNGSTPYFTEAIPQPHRALQSAATSARWTADNPLARHTTTLQLDTPPPTRDRVRQTETLQAEPGTSVHGIIDLVRAQELVLGVDRDTAIDHVLGPNHVAGRHMDTLTGYQSSLSRADRQAIIRKARRGLDPVHPEGAAAKALTGAEMDRIERARKQGALFRQQEVRAAQPLHEVQELDQAGMNELVLSIIEQARSTATIKRHTGSKTDGARLSWVDRNSHAIADSVRRRQDIVPVDVADGETAEIVTADVTGEPTNPDAAFEGLMQIVNPDGGVMLARVPLDTGATLLDKYRDPSGENVKALAKDKTSMVVVYTRPIMSPLPNF